MKKLVILMLVVLGLNVAQGKSLINIYAPNDIYGDTPPSEAYIYTCIKNSQKMRPTHYNRRRNRHRRPVYYHLYPDGYYYMDNVCRKNFIPYKYRVKPKR